MISRYVLPAAAAGALALGGCASNYGVEGAAVGGLGGAAVGSLVKKDGRCYRVSRNGRQYEVRC